MDFEVLRNILTGFLRNLLTPIIAYLSLNGYISDNEAVQLTAIAASLVVALAWSLISKLWENEKLVTALELPAGATKAKLNDVIRNG